MSNESRHTSPVNSRKIFVLNKILIHLQHQLDVDSWLLDLSRTSKNTITVTPNLNHLRILSKDAEIFHLYDSANYFFCDGMPLIWLNKRFKRKKESQLRRVSGVELCGSILDRQDELFVIGSSAAIVKKLLDSTNFPNLKTRMLSVNHENFDINQIADFATKISDQLRESKAKNVLVCLGFPKQELISYLLREFEYPTPKNFICVGGSLDILSENFSRAPEFLQSRGLEWLWRMTQDFKRLFPRYSKDFLFLIQVIFLMFNYSKKCKNL